MHRLLLTLVSLVAAAALASPAGAAPTWLELDRNTNLNSVLTMHLESPPKHIAQSWRAGSGNGSTNECAVGKGWLPAGWYDLKGHWDNYDASLVKGRVFLLQNKQCWNGTWRTELFIHSEETASNGQLCPTSGDDPFCWEGASDYASAGCIKLSRSGNPSDLQAVHSAWHLRSGDTRHGAFTVSRWLNVHD